MSLTTKIKHILRNNYKNRTLFTKILVKKKILKTNTYIKIIMVLNIQTFSDIDIIKIVLKVDECLSENKLSI